MYRKNKNVIIYTGLVVVLIVVYSFLFQELYYFDENMAKLEQKYQQETEEIMLQIIEKAKEYELKNTDPNCWGCPQPLK